MRQKYDSSVIFLYATGNEHLLPSEFKKKIPYTTISTWRKTNYDSYIGNEFRYFFTDAFEQANLKTKYDEMKGMMMGFARSWIALSSSIEPLIKNAAKDKKLQRKILESIEYMIKYIGLEKSLKLIGLSKTLYHQWVLEARFDCFDSFTSLCIKRHPQQLALKEINKIKLLLTDPTYDHWPIVSIASLAMRKKKIVASLYSWYKYARLFQITKKLVKKDRKTIGLIATCPNEYLHVDTTYYELIDGQKICITFVMDNYSKMILGFHVAEHLSFEVVKQALAKSMKVIMTHPDQLHSTLVADGGRENHNKEIDKFIAELTQHKITKVRALKDIRFSNSPVEAVHRTIKGRYLKNRKFESMKEVYSYLEWAQEDYNILRPHYKHRPRTPYEVYFNIPLGFDIRKRVKKAIRNRVEHNKCSACTECSGFLKSGKCANKKSVNSPYVTT